MTLKELVATELRGKPYEEVYRYVGCRRERFPGARAVLTRAKKEAGEGWRKWLSDHNVVAVVGEGMKASKKLKKKGGFKLDPTSQAIRDLLDRIENEPAEVFLSGLQKQFTSGVGLDVSYAEALTQARDWLTKVIEGAHKLTVSCDDSIACETRR